MTTFDRRRKIQRILYSLPVLLMFSVVAFFLAKGAVRVVGTQRAMAEHSRTLTEQAVALAARAETLEKSIARLQTEAGVKDEIKEKFSVTQEGEYIAVIIDNQEEGSDSLRSAWPWYKRLWIAIMGIK